MNVSARVASLAINKKNNTMKTSYKNQLSVKKNSSTIKKILKQSRSLCLFFAWFAYALIKPSVLFAITPTADNLFGTIEAPEGVKAYQAKVGPDEIGIILFFSNIIRLITIFAGIWTMLNFVLAGWIYITGADDKDAGSKVSTKMLNSVMGLAIVALSYTIAALVGLLIFGNAMYIIQPELQSVLD